MQGTSLYAFQPVTYLCIPACDLRKWTYTYQPVTYQLVILPRRFSIVQQASVAASDNFVVLHSKMLACVGFVMDTLV